MLQTEHEILPRATHDEMARQEFVRSFKEYLSSRVAPGNREVYRTRVLPEFKKQHKRAPRSRHEVRKAMSKDRYYRFWSSMQRTSQEMMWDSVSTSVERQLDELIDKARKVSRGRTLGSLTLDPELAVPRYHTAVDIHCQPGGYHTELKEDDVAAGAIYDRGVYIYAMGRTGPFNSDMGDSAVAHVRSKYPDFDPAKILDMGCTVGHSTLPWVDAYPSAEVYGIDVAAPVLRYAYTRANLLGRKVHFQQQNSEGTRFEDGSFDMVVSHILLHETSGKAIRNIIRECHRLLRPGGMMVHLEVPPYSLLEDVFDEFMMDWDAHNNNEPFWSGSHEIDYERLAIESGFDRSEIKLTFTPSVLAEARAQTASFEGGNCGGGQWVPEWFLFIARK